MCKPSSDLRFPRRLEIGEARRPEETGGTTPATPTMMGVS